MSLEERIEKFTKNLSNISTSYQKLIEDLNGYNGWRLTRLKIDFIKGEARATMNLKLKTEEQYKWLINYYENQELTHTNKFEKKGLIIEYKEPRIIKLKNLKDFNFYSEKEIKNLRKEINKKENQKSYFNIFIDLSVKEPLTYLPLVFDS